LFGHVHQEFDENLSGIRIIGTPSTCRQFKPGSDQFVLDDRPPAYRRVSLHGDGSLSSELIWMTGK
jgi:Icc protein